MRFASFLKPLLHRSTPGAADGVPPDPVPPPASSLNRGMPIEVMKDFDTVLLFGKLAEAGPACLKIERIQGGTCIVSEQRYEPGQALHIRIGTAQDSAVYPCHVVRSTPRWGGSFEYGLQFAHLDRERRGQLAREIQTIREETGKRLLPDEAHAGLPGGNGPEPK